MNFKIPRFTNLAIKLKESEKRDEYPNLAREPKKLWNIKVMLKLILLGALGKISKGFVKGLEDLEIRGLLSILANLCNAVVWMVLVCAPISNPSSSFGDCSECTNYNWYLHHFHVQ